MNGLFRKERPFFFSSILKNKYICVTIQGKPAYTMKRILTGISFLLITISFAANAQTSGSRFITYIADLKKQQLQLYWKDDQHKPFGSIQRLKSWLEARKQQLVFAMNGGMYKPGHSPLEQRIYS